MEIRMVDENTVGVIRDEETITKTELDAAIERVPAEIAQLEARIVLYQTELAEYVAQRALLE